jgi:hypothetical protein
MIMTLPKGYSPYKKTESGHSCPRADLCPDYCECCAKEGKNDVRKFKWKSHFMTGHFCSDGHFWELPPDTNIDYGYDEGT